VTQPPDPLFSCYLAVLDQAIIHARALALDGKSHRQIAHLLDAIHVIPELLRTWGKGRERGLFRYLEDFDKRYARLETDFSLTRVFHETNKRLVYPASP